MIPIEQTKDGVLVFLRCGCAAKRWMAHPTGMAFLVHIVEACGLHAGDQIRSILKDEEVSPFVRPREEAS